MSDIYNFIIIYPGFLYKVPSLERIPFSKHYGRDILVTVSFFCYMFIHFTYFFFIYSYFNCFPKLFCFIYFMKFDLIIPDWMISTSFVTPIMFTKCTAWWLITFPLTYKYSINTMCQVCIYKDVIICMGKCRSVSCSILQNHTAMYK